MNELRMNELWMNGLWMNGLFDQWTDGLTDRRMGGLMNGFLV